MRSAADRSERTPNGRFGSGGSVSDGRVASSGWLENAGSSANGFPLASACGAAFAAFARPSAPGNIP
jgi:hypothetical protein